MFHKFLESACDLSDVLEVIRSYEHVVFLGTGGSSLVGQTLKAIASADHMTFFDNIDPRTFEEKIMPLAQKKTFFVIISKSGGTSETLFQTLSLLPYLTDNVAVITETKDSPLMVLAKQHYWRVIPHPQEIGGRFSAFTVVGLLPCAVAGLSIEKYIVGAKTAIEKQEQIKECIQYIFEHYPIQKTVLLSYSDYTTPLLQWMSQLLAESLGKVNENNEPTGLTPIIAKGTSDQHSQLQLWMDGPKDSVFEVFYFERKESARISVAPHPAHDVFAMLSGHSYDELFKAHCMATVEALKTAGYHVTFKAFESLDEEVVGYLMMEKIIETFHLAKLMSVQAEGQPGVERAKKLIGVYL